jgi:hypothetical protein
MLNVNQRQLEVFIHLFLRNVSKGSFDFSILHCIRLFKTSTIGDFFFLVQNFNEIAEDGRQMTVLRKKTDHASCVFLVKYQDTDEESYRRELNALKLLKGK